MAGPGLLFYRQLMDDFWGRCELRGKGGLLLECVDSGDRALTLGMFFVVESRVTF